MSETTSNPLAGMVPWLAHVPEPPADSWRWAEVTNLYPLRIRFAADDAPSEAVPLSLTPVGDLWVGARVLVMQQGTQDTVIGPARGGGKDLAVAQPVPLSGSWKPYETFGVPRCRLVGDRVELDGAVNGGYGGKDEPIGVLPPAMRPRFTRLLVASTAQGPADLRVTGAGQIRLESPMSTLSWVSLSGVFFLLP